jgi:hypothetical protein
MGGSYPWERCTPRAINDKDGFVFPELFADMEDARKGLDLDILA